MTTYNSYEAAKIANPDKEILTDHKKVEFTAELGLNYYHKCNPADHCMTVDKFLADGHKFVEGDVFINSPGKVKTVTNNDKWISTLNLRGFGDNERYILRAAALEEKKPRTKVEYVKCEFHSDYEHLKLMIDGERFYTWDGEIEYSFNGARFIGKEKPNHNLQAEWTSPNSTELYRRIKTKITERDELLEALQSVWIIDGVDGQEQLEKIVDSGLFKLVN